MIHRTGSSTNSSNLSQVVSTTKHLGFSIGLGSIALFGGLLTLVGWYFDNPRLKDWIASGVTMKANAAVCASAAGLALILLSLRHRGRRGWVTGFVAAALGSSIAAVGGITLAEHIAEPWGGFNLGIDTLLFDEPPGERATAAPGRMGPVGSLSFLLLGGGLVLLCAPPHNHARRFAPALGVLVTSLVGVSLVGYMVGADQLYTLPKLTGIALQTSLMLLSIAIGMVIAASEQQPMRLLLERSAASILAWRLLPLIILLPVAITWLRVRGEQAGLYDSAFGSAVRAIVEVALLAALLWWAVSALSRYERSLRDALALKTKSELRFKTLSTLAPMGLFETDAQGNCLYVNQRWAEIAELSLEQARGRGWVNALHPDDRERVFREWYEAAQANREFESEYRFRKPDGKVTWLYGTATSLRDTEGEVVGYIGTIMDISVRKKAEEVLMRHAEMLAEAVRKRTAELERAHGRQRASERFASIGTLAAGLGHDMGNLLLPVRARLDALLADCAGERASAMGEHIKVIRDSLDYLQSLSRNLRMLAADPESVGLGDDCVNIKSWWEQAAPMLKNVLPRGTMLEGKIAEGLPLARIAPHQLTQVAFNLVQNAGDAIRSINVDHGKVTLWAEATGEEGELQLGVTDNGPGMTDEVKAHCLEPFYSTKTRLLSTGMGLSLVIGIMRRIGGTIVIDSAVGHGTTMILNLPAWSTSQENGIQTQHKNRIACIDLRDARLRAYLSSVLQTMGFDVRAGLCSDDAIAIWITDAVNGTLAEAAGPFFENCKNRRIVVIGDIATSDRSNLDERVTYLDRGMTIQDLQRAVTTAAAAVKLKPVAMT